MTDSRLYDFKVISKFKELYFKDLLQKQHLNEKELFIQDVKTPDDPDRIPEASLNDFFYELRKDGKSFLLPSKLVKELPLEAVETERVGYKGNGYRLIKRVRPAKFKPEKHMTFRELVDELAPFKHSEPLDFTLYKICVLAGLYDRINFRCSSQPAFGKDSFMSLLDDLSGEIGVVQNPTIAKLEFLSMNKILMINEVVNLETKEIRDIEQYLLSAGDFDNKYTKRSRGSLKHGSREEYDISNLSLVVCYNDEECYRDGTKYFDFMFQKAVMDRFPAFKFKGTLLETFEDVTNPTELAEANIEYYKKLIRTLNWYKKHWRKELKDYRKIDLGLSLRHSRVLDVISNFVNLYAKTEAEYITLIMKLKERMEEYQKMINPQQTWKDVMQVKEEYIE